MNGIDLEGLFNADQILLESALNPLQIVISLLITLLMSLFIYYVYRKTFIGVLYAENFNLTLVVTALVVNALMIGISGNIVLSLGLVGALSIIRYRTAVKDPKDTAYLFWAITVGVINGVAYYELSLIASGVIAAVMFFHTKIGSDENSYVLILRHAEGVFSQLAPLLKNSFRSFSVKSDSREGKTVEKVIEVKFKSKNQDRVLKDIRDSLGVEKCLLLSSSGDFSE